MGSSLLTRLEQRLELVGLPRLAPHLKGIPLPWLVQPGVGSIASMDPLLSLRLPSPPGGDEGQGRLGLAMAPRGLDAHQGTAGEGLATTRTKPGLSTLHPAGHDRTPHRGRGWIKRFSHPLWHGPHPRTIEDALLEPRTALADPIVDRDLPAAPAP
jgi:hypothetical protein